MVPMASGGGTAATKEPNAASGIAQNSTSIAAPLLFPIRTSPGRGGCAPRETHRGGNARRLRGLQQTRAARGELMIERQPRKMRTDHRQHHLAAHAVLRTLRRMRADAKPVAPEPHPASAMNARAQRGEQAVVVRLRDQRNARGQPVGAERTGNGERARSIRLTKLV